MTTRRMVLKRLLAALSLVGITLPVAAHPRRGRRTRTLVTLAREGRTGEERRLRRFLRNRGYQVVERLQYVPILVVLLDDAGREALRRHPDVQNLQSDDLSAPTGS